LLQLGIIIANRNKLQNETGNANRGANNNSDQSVLLFAKVYDRFFSNDTNTRNIATLRLNSRVIDGYKIDCDHDANEYQKRSERPYSGKK